MYVFCLRQNQTPKVSRAVFSRYFSRTKTPKAYVRFLNPCERSFAFNQTPDIFSLKKIRNARPCALSRARELDVSLYNLG